MANILTKFVNSTAKRPQGKWARRFYGEPKAHMKSFALMLQLLDPQPDDLFLEIGCGGGYFLNMIQARVDRVAAIDHSPDLVEVARRSNQKAMDQGRAEIVHGNAEELPWPDNSFTCTGNVSMWFFVEQPVKVLAELLRVLQPGGRLVMVTLQRTWINRIVWSLYGLRLYTDGQMEDMLRQAGFAEIRVSSPGIIGQIATARKPSEPA
jgi:ubiquinone/menaquinone biosynthesis C-methylase UbiE